jgi:hypothetical protein
MYDTSAKGVNRLRILLEQEQKKKKQNKGILKALALTTEYYGVDSFLLLKCFFTVKKKKCLLVFGVAPSNFNDDHL